MYILLKENMNKENVKSVLWHLFPATSESSIIIGTDNGRKKKEKPFYIVSLIFIIPVRRIHISVLLMFPQPSSKHPVT